MSGNPVFSTQICAVSRFKEQRIQFSQFRVGLIWLAFNLSYTQLFCLFGFLALFVSPTVMLPSVFCIKNTNRETTARRILFGIVMLGIGYGSFVFHATFDKAGRLTFFLKSSYLDFFGLIGILCFITTFSITRLCSLTNDSTFIGIFTVLYLVNLTIRLVSDFAFKVDLVDNLFFANLGIPVVIELGIFIHYRIMLKKGDASIYSTVEYKWLIAAIVLFAITEV
jgi:hypothetical protein